MKGEHAIYEKISDELETNSVDKALWMRLFAENEGDEVKTKVDYIKQRAAFLCGASLISQDKGASTVESVTTWKATGKVSIIRHPLVKGKEPLEGEWKYNKGTIQRRVLFKFQSIDLRGEVLSAELAPEPISLLAGLKKSQEATTAYLTLLYASPLLSMAYTNRKQKTLQDKLLMDIILKDGTDFLAFTTVEILAEIMSNFSPEGP
jgi:hypothetical protein